MVACVYILVNPRVSASDSDRPEEDRVTRIVSGTTLFKRRHSHSSSENHLKFWFSLGLTDFHINELWLSPHRRIWSGKMDTRHLQHFKRHELLLHISWQHW